MVAGARNSGFLSFFLVEALLLGVFPFTGVFIPEEIFILETISPNLASIFLCKVLSN